MIQKINAVIKAQKNGIIDSSDIFVIDYKSINGGQVEVVDNKPEFHCVHLSNVNNVQLFYVTFLDNAFRVDASDGQVEQCECVIFPSTLEKEDWVLFIETKYSANYKAALDAGYDYPNKMINQIISTVDYFRKNEILSLDKQVNAIVSFPILIEAFSEAIFTRSELTQIEISLKYKITLRATNQGAIISKKRIKT